MLRKFDKIAPRAIESLFKLTDAGMLASVFQRMPITHSEKVVSALASHVAALRALDRLRLLREEKSEVEAAATRGGLTEELEDLNARLAVDAKLYELMTGSKASFE